MGKCHSIPAKELEANEFHANKPQAKEYHAEASEGFQTKESQAETVDEVSESLDDDDFESNESETQSNGSEAPTKANLDLFETIRKDNEEDAKTYIANFKALRVAIMKDKFEQIDNLIQNLANIPSYFQRLTHEEKLGIQEYYTNEDEQQWSEQVKALATDRDFYNTFCKGYKGEYNSLLTECTTRVREQEYERSREVAWNKRLKEISEMEGRWKVLVKAARKGIREIKRSVKKHADHDLVKGLRNEIKSENVAVKELKTIDFKTKGYSVKKHLIEKAARVNKNVVALLDSCKTILEICDEELRQAADDHQYLEDGKQAEDIDEEWEEIMESALRAKGWVSSCETHKPSRNKIKKIKELLSNLDTIYFKYKKSNGKDDSLDKANEIMDEVRKQNMKLLANKDLLHHLYAQKSAASNKEKMVKRGENDHLETIPEEIETHRRLNSSPNGNISEWNVGTMFLMIISFLVLFLIFRRWSKAPTGNKESRKTSVVPLERVVVHVE